MDIILNDPSDYVIRTAPGHGGAGDQGGMKASDVEGVHSSNAKEGIKQIDSDSPALVTVPDVILHGPNTSSPPPRPSPDGIELQPQNSGDAGDLNLNNV